MRALSSLHSRRAATAAAATMHAKERHELRSQGRKARACLQKLRSAKRNTIARQQTESPACAAC